MLCPNNGTVLISMSDAVAGPLVVTTDRRHEMESLIKPGIDDTQVQQVRKLG